MKNFLNNIKRDAILCYREYELYDIYINAIYIISDFLQPGFTGICSFKKTLRYLENWKGTCIQNDLTNMNQYLFSITFSNFTVINSLPSFNDTFVQKQVQF